MKSIKEYMDLPYNYIIQPIKDESGSYYHAKVLELDGCQSTGDTFEEAYESLKEAMEFWIESKLELGMKIPLPVSENAKKLLEEISQSEYEQELAFKRDLYLMDKEAIKAAGYDKGTQEEKIKIAKKLLKENIDIAIIMKVTELTEEEIREIK